jgi:hypothetical protein
MNEKSKKLVRYSTAAAALLAVSGGANAAIVPGTITSTNGENTLDDTFDEIFVDIDSNGEIDFLGIVVGYSGSFYGSFYQYKYFLFGSYESGRMVEIDGYAYYPIIKKFFLNENIGPLASSSSYGMISEYSEGGFTSPPMAPFNPSNDTGYIGVSVDDGGGPKYGWVNIQISEEGDFIEFISAGSESVPNRSILAGSSATVPLLPIASAAGLGLIGLMAAMKKRRKLTA